MQNFSMFFLYKIGKFVKLINETSLCTIITLDIGTPYFLKILVLKFRKSNLFLSDRLKMLLLSGKQSRP